MGVPGQPNTSKHTNYVKSKTQIKPQFLFYRTKKNIGENGMEEKKLAIETLDCACNCAMEDTRNYTLSSKCACLCVCIVNRIQEFVGKY